MNKVKRMRNNAVTIRMTDYERGYLDNMVEESGLSMQTFIIRAIKGAVIRPSDEIIILKEISKTFADHERQLRGMATNINQLAHIANAQGDLPIEQQLAKISQLISDYRKESEEIWLLIRSSINQQKPMEQ